MIFLASVRFRGLPSATGLSIYVRASGPTTESSAAFPRIMRILAWFRLFLVSVSFRGIPRAPVGLRLVHIYCDVSGTETLSPNAVFPGNIRTLGGFMPFRASVSFRALA